MFETIFIIAGLVAGVGLTWLGLRMLLKTLPERREP